MGATHAQGLLDRPLLSRAMSAVMVAQFLSALADNTLLFAAIALLRSQLAPGWQIPLLQESFVVAFILLAPFVGPFADSLPKGRVMLIANGLKFLGAAAMLSGLHPLLAYGMVGIGAAAYSPAKYGILRELFDANRLIKANSLIEGSTIVAILLGAILGGMLADASVTRALATVVLGYIGAGVANLFIPRLQPAQALSRYSFSTMMKDFMNALCALLRSSDTRFSLIGTSIFWGAGSTLRLILIAWVPVALGIANLSTPANLSGAVAIGIALGAVAAAKLVSLSTVNRALPAGILIGLLIVALANCINLYIAAALLVFIGACGGFYIVPLNALLQERGHTSVGAGHAIAVQNLLENFCMLLMVGLYTWLERSGMLVLDITVAIGLLVFFAIGLLTVLRLR